MVKEVTSTAEFNALVNDASKVVFVDFFATWCGPCVQISPVFADLASKHEGPNVVFIKVDVDKLADVARDRGIRAMPTFKVFKGGKEIGELVGASKGGLEQLIAKHK